MQLIQKLRGDQKCMKKVVPSSRSKATKDIISIGSFVEVLVLNHYVLVRKILGKLSKLHDEVAQNKTNIQEPQKPCLLDHKIQQLSKGSSEGSGTTLEVPDEPKDNSAVVAEKQAGYVQTNLTLSSAKLEIQSMVDVPIHQEDLAVQRTPLIDPVISMVTEKTTSTPTPPTTQAHAIENVTNDDVYLLIGVIKDGMVRYYVPMILPERRDLPGTLLVSVEVLGTSNEVSVSTDGVEEFKRKVKINGEKKAALLKH
ncbi:hypothetical protein Tco_1406777 [Tanacetum coccineum]